MLAVRSRNTIWALMVSITTLQAQTATITGSITDPDGGLVKDAVVQAKNSATGTVIRAIPSPQGEYKLDVPAGTYDLAVPMPCCQWGSFAQSNVAVRGGQPLRFN